MIEANVRITKVNSPGRMFWYGPGEYAFVMGGCGFWEKSLCTLSVAFYDILIEGDLYD